MVPVLAAFALYGSSTIATIDELAQKRDSTSLENLATPELKGRFQFLKGAGAYGVGGKGWTAKELHDVASDRTFVVFTTPLTTQDLGEQVFEIKNDRLVNFIPESDTLGVRETHLDVTLDKLDVPTKTIGLTAKVQFKKGGTAGKSFLVRLGDNYTVTKVTDAENNPTSFSQAGGTISLPTPSSTEFQYTISYEGVVNRPRFAGAFGTDEVMLTNDYWWPNIGRLPVSYTFTATVPADWFVMGQGNLLSQTQQGDKKTFAYKMPLPTSYLSVALGKYQSVESKVNGRTYRVVTKELSTEEMRDQLAFNPPIIEFFNSVHPYPFDTWTSFITDLYGGGALEAYSYATYGTGWLPAEDPHEPSHTWFGGIVPNTYLKSFWNESFAAFSEGWFSRECQIGNKDDRQLAFTGVGNPSQAYTRAAAWSAGVDAKGVASSLGYGKGAEVLQQLQFEMGRPAFLQAVRSFLNNQKPGEPGDWQDFATACGPQYTKFFDQWLKRPGYATFEVSDLRFNQGKALVNVKFTSEPYDLLAQVLIRTTKGDQIQTVKIHPDPVSKSAIIELNTNEPPKLISIDPYDRILGPQKPRVPERFQSSTRFKTYVQAGYESPFRSSARLDSVPSDLAGVLIIGDPFGTPILASLISKAGATIKNNQISFKGQSVSLDKGAFVATVEIRPGELCAIMVGKTKFAPNVGNAKAALVDNYGRLLAATTEPRTNGPLVLTAN